ncbi:MAG: LON peptidase substrate-binding domain-containing protein, partial [Burkholderiaceae bacterium]
MDNEKPVENMDRTNEDKGIPVVPDDALIIIPVRSMVLFPGLVVPIVLEERAVQAAQEAARAERQIGVVLQKEVEGADQAVDDSLYQAGTVASILRYVTTPDGLHHIICQGEQRFRIREFLGGFSFTVARVERLKEQQDINPEIEALMIQLKTRTAEVFQLLPQVPAELAAAAQSIASAGALADFVAGVMDLKPAEKQDI